MKDYDPRGELAPRDIVARAIDSEMKTSGDDCVFLDITHRPAPFIIDRFPHIYESCLSYGIDISKEPIPVVPAAHYMCGGVVTGLDGSTSLAGLYTAGEVSFTGLHGANRLASNSLLEAVVYSHLAADSAITAHGSRQPVPTAEPWDPGGAAASTEEVVVSQSWDAIRRLMWNYVGIVRSDSRLEKARKQICIIMEDVTEYYYSVLINGDLIELRNIAALAELIIASATQRKESRGLHYNIDHQGRDDANWGRDIILRRGSGEFC
jgi:L-aspartate oxidase